MAPATTNIPDWVASGIAKSVDEPRQATPGRYPFTYAYDFLRSHAGEFGAPFDMSRAQTSGWLRERLGVPRDVDSNPLLEQVCRALADAYLKENNEYLP